MNDQSYLSHPKNTNISLNIQVFMYTTKIPIIYLHLLIYIKYNIHHYSLEYHVDNSYAN